MSTLQTNSLKTEMARIVGYQLAIIMGLALMVAIIKSITTGLGVLGGGLAYWLPTCFFMLGVSTFNGARAGLRFLVAFMLGEAIKLVLSGLLFLALIVYFHFNLFYALCGFMVAIAAFWISSFVSLSKGARAWQ